MGNTSAPGRPLIGASARGSGGHRGAAWLLLLSLTACPSAGGGQSDPLPGEASIGLGRGETLPSFIPADSAGDNWARAEAAFAEENYLLAQRYYVYIRRKFPYSKFSVLSDLRIADCQYDRERYLEAIDSYQNFVRLHPTHPKVPYAMFRTGLAYEEQIPTDWFFLPPAYEKDQTAVTDTANALSAYLQRFPEDENADEARKMLEKVRERLMSHERYVADFYEREGKLKGYVGRLERMKTKYGDVALDPKLLLEIVEAYVRLEDRAKAETAVAELADKFPEARELARARAAVERIPPPPSPLLDGEGASSP